MQQPMTPPPVAAEVRRRISCVARAVRLLASAATLLGLLSAPAFAQHGTNAAAEAKLKQLQVAPGLKVELVATEPLLQNPVAFSVDERGRFFIAETHRWKSAVFDITQRVPWLLDDLSCRTVADREALLHRHFPGTNFATLTNYSERIRLVEDTDGDGRADKSTVIADGFNSAVSGPAAGILARRGDVWFANTPDLWKISTGKLRMSNAPSSTVGHPSPIPHSQFAIRNLAANLGVHISVSGHDLHGLTFGPDGRLYFSLGDRGFELRPGMKHPGFSADYLRRIAPDTGAVFRCQPDGSELEVFCIGLRNPQGLAFDALGNLFTVDNDTAGPDKARLLHLVEGGDYGWRISYQHMKHFGPWGTEGLWRGGAGDILPTCGEAAQGPAGFAFYPGTGLPDRYTNHFFICDFPGGIWSFSLKPRGASFELAAREKFLWNLLPTHAAFGPDGALYVSDWVEGWGQPEKGRLYRVSDPAQAGNAKLAEVKRVLAEGLAGKPEGEVIELLRHGNLNVRSTAQSELTKRLQLPPWTRTMGAGELWSHLMPPSDRRHLKALTSGDPNWLELAAIQSLRANADADAYRTHTGVMALLGKGKFDVIQHAARDESPAVRRAAMLCMQRLLRPEIAQFLRDPDPRLVLEAARAINDAGIEPAYPALAALLDPSRRRREESLTSSPDANPQTPDPSQRLLTSSPTEALLRRALNAHYRLGHATNAQALAEFAAGAEAHRSGAAVPAAGSRSGVPPEPATGTVAKTPAAVGTTAPLAPALADVLRAEALFLLSAWEVLPATPGNVPVRIASVDGHGSTPLVNPENWPGWFDRVCGLWRPLPPRTADAARAALLARPSDVVTTGTDTAPTRHRNVELPVPLYALALNAPGTNTQLAAIAAVEKLALTEAAPYLAALLKDATQPAPVRVASLRTLGHSAFRTPPSALLSDSVTFALSDTNSLVRREAVKLAAAANPTTAVPLLGRVLTEEKDIRLRQAAITALGDLPGPAADAVLAQQLALLTEKKLCPELHLEVLEAAAKRPALAAKVGQASRLSSIVSIPAPAVGKSAKEIDGMSGGTPDLLHAFRPTLAGGDAAEGKRVFHEHAGAQCLRCHAVRGNGGIVGPGLTGVGKRLTREQLLESIVLPNQTIAAGFENATIVLKGGVSHNGLVKSDTKSL